jgi:predicted DNA-binding protein
MTLTVKLDERAERALDEYCRQAGETKSALIRRLIEGYLAGQPRRSPAEVYDEVTAGRAPVSDRAAVSHDHSRFIKAKLRARHGAR